MDIVHPTKNHTAPRMVTRLNNGNQPVLYLPDEPLIAGGTRGNFIFERHKVLPGELPPHVFEDHMFLLPMSAVAVPFHSSLNGHLVNGMLEPGRFRFLAAGDSLSTAWDTPLEAILIAVHPDVLHRALGCDVSRASFDLASQLLPHDDAVLANLTLALQSYLESGCLAGKLFEQSVVTAIAAHLIHAYGQGTRQGNGRGAPLIRWKWKRIEEYVRQNLGRGDLDLGEIAAVVDMSPCHLSRTFRTTTGQGLWQFVLECRAREAMRMMNRKYSPSLAYIAHSCGFESYSQFIAAFRKLYGQLPSQYRRTRGK